MGNDYHSLDSVPTNRGGYRPASSDEPSLGSATTRDGRDVSTKRPQPSLGRIDQYELVRKLGGGGFGVVYLARDTNSGVNVALKTLHPLLKSNEEEMERLREKFALVSRLTHTNIAKALVLHPVREVAITDETARLELRLSPGDSVMVMDYAPGVTLSKWRRQFPSGIVPLPLAIEIGRQIASALDYAHGEKIVHRDIKPSNVMVETLPPEEPQPSTKDEVRSTKDEGDGEPPLVTRHPSLVTSRIRVRILDFGLAAEIHSSMSRVSTEKGDTSGTRPYMAPEQWMGRKQDGRADQYALACLLYELLSGEPPLSGVFDTGDPEVIRTAVERDAPCQIKGVPSAVNRALLRALSKKPQGRFASCSDFVVALSDKMPFGGLMPFSGLTNFFGHRWAKYSAVAVAAAFVLAVIVSAVKKPHSTTSKPPLTPSHHNSETGDEADANPQMDWDGIEQRARQEHRDKTSREATRDANRALLNDIRRKVRERIQSISKYEKYNDRVFVKMRSSIYDNLAKIEATTDPDEIETVKRLRTDIDDVVDWILHNGPARDGIAAQEEKLRTLDLELKRISAESLAASTYNKAKSEQKRASEYCDKGEFGKAASQYAKVDSLYNKALAEAKAIHADDCVVRAEKFKENNLWDDCLKYAEEALSWNPNNAKALALKQEAADHVYHVPDATWLPANSIGALAIDYKALRAFPMVVKLIDNAIQMDIFVKDIQKDVSKLLVAMLPSATPNERYGLFFVSGTFDTTLIAAKLKGDPNCTVSVKDGVTVYAPKSATGKPTYAVFPSKGLIVGSDNLDALFAGLKTMQKKSPALASDSMISRAIAKNFPLVLVADTSFLSKQGVTMPVGGGALPSFCAFTLRAKDTAHLLANLTGVFASDEEASQMATTLNGMKMLYAAQLAANPEAAPFANLLAALSVGSNGKNVTASATIDEAMLNSTSSISDPGRTEKTGKDISLKTDVERLFDKGLERKLEAGTEENINLGGGVKLVMVHCPNIAKDFWMGKYEVTQEQWRSVMGTSPSHFQGPRNPVESVSWNDCKEFVKKLNEKPSVRSSGLTFRLPTAEEWETACRADGPKSAKYCKLSDGTQIISSSLSRVARYDKGWWDGPTDVGSLEPNAYGLYDMHGNVWEWTETADGSYRIDCGGSFNSSSVLCQVGNRNKLRPGNSFRGLGFRLAATGKAAQ